MATDLGVKLGVEGEREFKKALADINASFKVLGSEMKLVESQFDKQDNSVTALAARNEVLNKQIAQQAEKVEVLKKALENASSSFGENDRRTQAWAAQLNNAQAELNNLQRDLKKNESAIENVADEMDDAADETDRFGDELKDTADEAGKSHGKFEKLGSVVKGIGAAIGASLVAVGAAVGAAVSKVNDCVEVYAGFEDSMRQVAATMGISADEIANGSKSYELLENAAKEAGASTRYSASEASQALNYLALAGYDAEKAAETLPKVLNLAAAGGMELSTTSDLVTDAMSALGMETSELDVFIDQMAKTSQKSNTSVQQLGEAILTCAGTVSTTGQDLTVMNTALGVLADNGIKGAEGGTHLRNILLSLSSPTDKAADRLAALGISVFDAQGNMRQIDDILGDLNNSLSSLTQEGKTNAINDIFNKTDLGAVNALLGATSGRFTELAGVIEDSAGAATAMADTMESGLAGTERSFNSAVEGMQIEIGSLFAGMKNDLLGETTDIIRAFTTALSKADGNWNKIGEAVGEAVSGIADMVMNNLPAIVEVGMSIIMALVNAITSNITTVVDCAVSIVMTLLDGLIQALPAITTGAVQLILALVQGLVDNLPAIIEAALVMVITLAEGIGEALPELIPAIVDAIVFIAETLIDYLDEIIMAAFKIVEGLSQGLLKALPKLMDALPQIISCIISFVTDNLPEIVYMGIQIAMQLAVGLIQALPQIMEALPQIVNTILDGLGGIVNSVFEIGANIVRGIWEGICSLGSWIGENVSGFFGGIVDDIKEFLGIHSPSRVFAGIGENMGLGVGVGFENAMSNVEKEMQDSIPTDFDLGLDGISNDISWESKTTIEHTGIIRVEGVNSDGDMSAVVDIIINQLRQEARI